MFSTFERADEQPDGSPFAYRARRAAHRNYPLRLFTWPVRAVFGFIMLSLRRPALTLGFGILAYWKWDTTTLPALQAAYAFAHPLALVALEQIKRAVKWVERTDILDAVLRMGPGDMRSAARFLWVFLDRIRGLA